MCVLFNQLIIVLIVFEFKSFVCLVQSKHYCFSLCVQTVLLTSCLYISRLQHLGAGGWTLQSFEIRATRYWLRTNL